MTVEEIGRNKHGVRIATIKFDAGEMALLAVVLRHYAERFPRAALGHLSMQLAAELQTAMLPTEYYQQ